MQIENFIVPIDMPIVEIMKQIEHNLKGIVYVCDEDRRILGVITDGDVRRAIISTGNLNLKADGVMKTEPIVLSEDERGMAHIVMKKKFIRSVPILDQDNRIVEIRFLDADVIDREKIIDVPVVIMAGGKGVRLQPYTNILPKPLIPIGEKTITEHIITRFVQAGCSSFDMIVNYKKHIIKAYFRDLDTNININFIDEEQFLGTAGGLRLLIGKYNDSFFMTNCDILIQEDYSKILKFHKENGNLATIVGAVTNTSIPYGVLETTADGRVTALKEKPNISTIVSTGLYVLEPEFLERIPENQSVDITDVLQECIDNGLRIGMYPISDNHWLDMGQMEELEKMTKRLGDIG